MTLPWREAATLQRETGAVVGHCSALVLPQLQLPLMPGADPAYWCPGHA